MIGNENGVDEISGASRAVRGTLVLYLQGLATSFAALGFAMLMTRILNRHDVGILYTVTTFTTILTTIGSIAIFNASSRFIADAYGRDDRNQAKRIAMTTIILGIFMSLAMGCVVLILFPFVFLTFQIELPSNFAWAALAVDVLSSCFLGYLASVLLGARKYNLQAGSIVLAVSLRYLFASILLMLGGSMADAVVGWAIGGSIGVFCVASLTIAQLKPVARGSISDLKRMLVFSAPLFLSMIVGLLNANIERIVLLAIVDLTTFGVYSVGLSVSSLLTIAGTSLYSVALTEQSRARGRGVECIEDVSKSAFRYVFLVYTPLAVVLSLFSIPIVSSLFTIAYLDSFIVVAAIGFTRSLLCYDLVANGFLLAHNNPRALLYGSIIASFFQILVALVLIEPFGILGAALSRCTMIAILSLYPLIVIKRLHNFIPDFVFQGKILIISYLPVLPSLFIIGNLSQFASIPLALSVYALLYLLGLRITSTITPQDIETIVTLVPKRYQLSVYRLGVKMVVKSK